MDKSYLEWCEIMHQKPNERDQIIFMAGATFYSLDQKAEHEANTNNDVHCENCGCEKVEEAFICQDCVGKQDYDN